MFVKKQIKTQKPQIPIFKLQKKFEKKFTLIKIRLVGVPE